MGMGQGEVGWGGGGQDKSKDLQAGRGRGGVIGKFFMLLNKTIYKWQFFKNMNLFTGRNGMKNGVGQPIFFTAGCPSQMSRMVMVGTGGISKTDEFFVKFPNGL